MIVPFKEISVDAPAVAINSKYRLEEGKLLRDLADDAAVGLNFKSGQPGQQHLLQCADVLVEAVKNLQQLAPGQLAPNGKDGLARLVVDIGTLKQVLLTWLPRFEIETYGRVIGEITKGEERICLC